MNVLQDRWIPVRTQENQHIRVTLPDFYAHAHEYKAIETENLFDEFSLARFLALFAHCAYEPKDESAIQQMAETGHFPMEPIHRYIDLCKSEGVTFELFDKKRPFLQAIPDDSLDTEKVLSPISKMDYIYAYGNTPIHRSPHFQEDYAFHVEDCPIKLLSQYVYSRHKAGGYETTPAGTPTFFLPNAENLFQTILFSMPPVNKDREGTKEFWRSPQAGPEEIVPRRIVPIPSLRYGMIFPCRRIVFLPPEEDGLVHRCYYQPGISAKTLADKQILWKDDFVAINCGEKEEKLFNLAYNSDNFTILNRFFSNQIQLPPCISRYAAYLKRKGIQHIPAIAYVTATNQADYLGIQKIALQLRPAIYQDENAFLFLQYIVSFVGDSFKMLNESMLTVLPYNWRIKSYLLQYREEMVGLFIKQADSFEEQSLSLDELMHRLPALYETIQKRSIETFDRAMRELNASLFNLQPIERERKKLRSKLESFRKKRLQKEGLETST